MNTYEVKSDIRQTVTIWIAIISLILGNTLFRFSNFLAPLLAKHFSVIADFFCSVGIFGYSFFPNNSCNHICIY